MSILSAKNLNHDNDGIYHSINSPENKSIRNTFLKNPMRSHMRQSSLNEEKFLRDELKRVKKELDDKTKLVSRFKSQNSFGIIRIKDFQLELESKNEEAKKRYMEINSKDKEISTLKLFLDELKKEINDLKMNNTLFQENFSLLHKSYSEKEMTIKKLKQQIFDEKNKSEQEISRLRQLFEVELKEKSKRTERTEISETLHVSQKPAEKHLIQSNCMNLTFEADYFPSESHLFQNDQISNENHVLQKFADIEQIDIKKGIETQNFFKNFFQLFRQKSVQNDFLNQKYEELLEKFRNQKIQMKKLKDFILHLMEKIEDLVESQRKTKEDLVKKITSFDNSMILKKLQDDNKPPNESSDLGSIIEKVEHLKPKHTRNNTEIGFKDQREIQNSNYVGNFERMLENANKNNKTFEVNRTCDRQFRQSNPRESPISNNQKSLMNPVEMKRYQNKTEFDQNNFTEAINFESNCQLHEILLSEKKKSELESLEFIHKNNSMKMDCCNSFLIEFKSFVEKYRMRFNQKNATIKLLTGYIRTLNKNFQTMNSAIETNTFSEEIFFNCLNEFEIPENVSKTTKMYLDKQHLLLIQNLTSLNSTIQKTNYRFWYEKLQIFYKGLFKNESFIPTIKEAILKDFNLIESKFKTDEIEFLENKITNLEDRLKGIIEKGAAKENIGSNPLAVFQRETVEKTKNSIILDEKWKKETTEMLKRFLGKIVSVELNFSNCGPIEFAQQIEKFIQKAKTNNKKMNSFAKVIFSQTQSGENSFEFLKLKSEQLVLRDELIIEIWQFFFESLRSICSEGNVFDNSNKPKVNILSKAVGDLMKELSGNSSFYIGHLAEKEKNNRNKIDLMSAYLEGDFDDECKMLGGIFNSVHRQSENPYNSIYTSFCYPMCFIHECLNLIRNY